VYGIKEALEQAKRNFEVYDTSGWPNMPPLVWHEIAYEENARVLEDEHWQVTASPGEHSVPTLGLKVVSRKSGKAVCYSADTAPSRAVARLARGCALLVHEATGEGPGHSSAKDAAKIAREAEVKALWLVHLPPEAKLDEAAMKEAREVFCETRKADEGGSYTF
jgi:ribonuclease Z